ncbi:response regulator [Tsuneonella deserti]|uniref:Response regulator n=1 Tax=Tsuneonella deserti TaxID=2035528 RepID=A0ABQ1SAP4_9SPHN|nr:response regulator [Tsuneonella deserti]GGE05831.1 response regulator [Tsuneonella deserti]
MNSHSPPLRILYLEDNQLIAFHVEALIEELGHVFVGSLCSFTELKEEFDSFEIDGALVDIDLTDGRTGPAAAAWLKERGVPSIFVTGQATLAAEYPSLTLATIAKPVSGQDLAEGLELFRNRAA